MLLNVSSRCLVAVQLGLGLRYFGPTFMAACEECCLRQVLPTLIWYGRNQHALMVAAQTSSWRLLRVLGLIKLVVKLIINLAQITIAFAIPRLHILLLSALDRRRSFPLALRNYVAGEL